MTAGLIDKLYKNILKQYWLAYNIIQISHTVQCAMPKMYLKSKVLEKVPAWSAVPYQVCLTSPAFKNPSMARMHDKGSFLLGSQRIRVTASEINNAAALHFFRFKHLPTRCHVWPGAIIRWRNQHSSKHIWAFLRTATRRRALFHIWCTKMSFISIAVSITGFVSHLDKRAAERDLPCFIRMHQFRLSLAMVLWLWKRKLNGGFAWQG